MPRKAAPAKTVDVVKRYVDGKAEQTAPPAVVPFKSKAWLKRTAGRRFFKSVRSILTLEQFERHSVDTPTFQSTAAPPSAIKPRAYCDFSGLEARYRDPKTKLLYHAASEYHMIRFLSENVVREYLKLRRAQAVLK